MSEVTSDLVAYRSETTAEVESVMELVAASGWAVGPAELWGAT